MDQLNTHFKTTPLLLLLLLFLAVLFEGILGQQQRLSSSIEHRALINLRSSLGLRGRDWPIKVDPCLGWIGVSCVNGSVGRINISGFRRTRAGNQNPQFSVGSLVNLTNLEVFNASLFHLPGQIPDLFGQSLGKLKVLDLSFCGVVGGIPSSLGNLTQLGNLNLSHNSITGAIPSNFGTLLNLSVVDLSWNLLNGSVPSSFVSLGNLIVLDVSRNSLSGTIPPVNNGTLSKLQKLNFSRNGLSGAVPAELGDLSGLVDLDLSDNSLVNSLPSDWIGMKSLRRLVVRNNSLSGELPGELIGGLTKLEFLDLSLNNFSGALPDKLWSLSSLIFVDASGNNFTGTLPTSLATVNATGARFNLANNKYYGELTSVIERFGSIDLSGNYFEGQVPAFPKSIVSVTLNCLQNVTGQKTLEECTSFYASKGLTFDNFGQLNNSGAPGPAPGTARKSHKQVIILAAIFGALGLFLILLLLGLLLMHIRKRGVTTQRGFGESPIPTVATPPSPGVTINFASLGEAFTYQVLLQATGDFSDANLIKHGHSGDLFHGLLEGGIPVVVKRANLHKVKREAYMHELDFLSKVSHTRLVPLLGHCLENENEKYLVYKYMPNGDMSSSLYRKLIPLDENGLQSLDWITRLKIAIGTAEGLCYLHHECSPPYVHRDVQASSVLLDDKFEVRLGSLSEICVQEMDAHQSVITRFLRIQQNSEQLSSGSQTSMCAYDVYCFGKVLLELVTGKMGISASNEASVKEWLDQTMQYIHIYDKELVNKIVDPSLIVDEDLLEEVWAMAIVARSCLNPNPSRRPLMKYILKALENPLRVVREENTGSARLRTSTSSRSSWNAGVFGSWRHSTSDAPAGPGSRAGSMKRSGTSGSQGSSAANNGGGDDNLSSQKRQSREIFPEPLAEYDIERQTEE